MMKKRILGLLLSVVLFTSSVGVGYAAENEENAGYNQEEINWNLDGFQEVETKITQLEESELPEELMAEEITAEEQEVIEEEEMVPVLIMFEEDSVIEGDNLAIIHNCFKNRSKYNFCLTIANISAKKPFHWSWFF